MLRKDRQISTEEALLICDKCDYAVLSMTDNSMTDSDNRPYAVPLSIVRDGMTIYFHAATRGHKTDCLRQNPHVCITCVGATRLTPQDFSTDYESAIIYGTATEITDPERKTHALRLISERYAPSNMSAFDDMIARYLSHTAVWQISIEEITGKRRRTNI